MVPPRPLWIRLLVCTAVFVAAIQSQVLAASDTHPWVRSPQFAETSFSTTLDSKIRVHVNAPIDDKGNAVRATWLIVYTLPAGNTIEHTLGSQMKPGLDWHYDIQHVAAQVRMLRTLVPNERIVLVCPEGPGLNWSAFRKAHKDANAQMARLVDDWRKEFGTDDTHVMLTGHSNGGSFMFGVIDGADEIPAYIDRIAFLDANYNFDAKQHTAKIERWLKGDAGRRLIVVAYDDRDIMLNGKKVLGPTGGTYRATGRMREALGKVFPLAQSTNAPFQETVGLDGRIHLYVHPNPQNKILHTLLVGEMNGLLHAATLGTPNEEKWGKFAGPRAYAKWIQPEPTPKSVGVDAKSAAAASGPTKTSGKRLETRRQANLPARPTGAMGGKEFMRSLEALSADDREAAILREVLKGNFPEFLRGFKAVPISGRVKGNDKDLSTTLEVMPDYLAVGSDSDFARIPMMPQTAQKIADKFSCTLPTRKMVDAIDAVAEVHVAPHAMTAEREAVVTFAQHNEIIEKQRAGQPVGLLTIGAKKDIVLTPRIFERPQRLAIYGWRLLDGKPIQPVAIVHWNRYVDYSHGVRLVRDEVELDGKGVKISELLEDADRCGLVSDEGPMKPSRYSDK